MPATHVLGYVRVVDPPERHAGEPTGQQLGGRLDLLGRDPVARASGDEDGHHVPRGRADTRADGADLVVARAVAEQHHPRVPVLAHVVEPVLEDRPHERVGLELLGELDPLEEGRQVGLVLLEQRHVERLLGVEVAVEDRLRHPAAAATSSSRAPA